MPSNSPEDGQEDAFRCGACGHAEPCAIDEVVGDEETRTFGSGRHEVERTVVVCPECGSSDWHSDSVAESLFSRSVGGQ